jgi:hypothetical protein
LVPQFEHPRSATKKQLLDGLLLLSLGLFMKVVLADALLADTADVFNSPDALSSLDAWTGVFAFSGQIFLDFAGYSTCAIGVALCLVLCCHRISIIRTPQSVFLISGKDGTLRCRPGCVTICTFRLAGIKTDA